MNFNLKISLLTVTSIIGGTFINTTAVQAATLAQSSTFLNLNNFSILPRNPDVDSNLKDIAFSGTSGIANANSNGLAAFIFDDTFQFISQNFASRASGTGVNYFAFSQAESSIASILNINANETLTFDFTASLNISNLIEGFGSESISNFAGLSFFLIDNNTNNTLGFFRAIGNLDTNLANNIDNDVLFAQGSNSNVSFSGTRIASFGGNNEFGQINLTGSFQQFFANPTQVRLVTSTLDRSCAQGRQTSDPCTKIPEPNSTVALILGLISLSFFKRSTLNKLVSKY
ncbi:MAG: hypothetical protein ACFCU5_05925 [Pleurocapsa sp.]